MNAATEFDLGPLTWVKGEIDLALQRAEEALEQFEAGVEGTPLKFCRTHVHQVYGALSIVGLDGVTQVTELIETLLAGMEEDSLSPGAAGVALLRQAFSGLRQYLDDLMVGEPNQPLRLMPVYLALNGMCGQTTAHPVDLFYPDLTQRPPRRIAPLAAMAPDQLKHAFKSERMRYQKGLLTWLKKPAEAEIGRQLMRQALIGIESNQATPTARTFWWVTQAFLEALRDPAIGADPAARQLCSHIDAQIRRLLEGASSVPDRVMREALYFVAQAPADLDPLIAQVQSVFALPSLLPIASLAAGPQPQDAALRKLRETIAATEELWNKFCTGSASSLVGFAENARSCAQLTEALGQTDLKRLGQGLAAVANWLFEDPARYNDAVAMEVATAILLLQNAQESFKRLGTDFAQQVDLMVARLYACIAGRAAADDEGIPLLDEMTRRAQEKLLIGQVGREIQNNLAQIEQALDGFFRDPAKGHDLVQLDGPLKQIGGALAMLGHFAAASSLKECGKRIQQFAQSDYLPANDDFEWVANQLSLIGFFVDALQNGETDFDAFVSRVKGEKPVVVAPLPPPPEKEPEAVPLADDENSPFSETCLVLEPFLSDRDGPLPPKEEPKIEPPIMGDFDFSSFTKPAKEAPQPTVETLQLAESTHAEIDAELLGIFLEEATEVLVTLGDQLSLLTADPRNVEALSTIRRSTHTLKGSGRMVGLTDLGESAWELEQTINLWLRQDQPITPDMLRLLGDERALFTRWVAYLESGQGGAPDPSGVISLARQLRGVETLISPPAAPPVEVPVAAQQVELPVPVAEDEAPSIVLDLLVPEEPIVVEPEVIEAPLTISDPHLQHAAEALEDLLVSEEPLLRSTPEKAEISQPIEALLPEAIQEPEPILPAAPAPQTLYEIFLEEARGHLLMLVESYAVLDANPALPTTIEMTRAAHTLGGIAATVGLMPLNRLAITLEHALLRRDGSAQPESIEGLETVRQAIITLESMFAGLADQQAPAEQLQLIAALDDIYHAPLAVPEPAAPASAEVIALPGLAIPAVMPERTPIAPAPQLPKLTDELDEQLLPLFLEEAADQLRDLTTQLRAWRAEPGNDAAPRAIARLLHTFKGNARMAGAMNLGEATHLLETRVEEAMRAAPATPVFIDEIESGCDAMAQAVERLRQGPQPGNEAEIELADDSPVFPEAMATVAAARGEAEGEASGQLATLRVRADLIDRLVNEAGELSIARSRIEGEMRSLKGSLLDLTENVIRLRRQLREIEIQAESQIQARVSHNPEGEAEFDPLELDRFTRFQELTRFMAESVNDVATVQQNLLKNLDDANAAILAQSRLNRSLQQELMGVRMIPFASQAERLYRIVRQTAKDVGKRANLDIVGGQVEIDRSVLDKMLAPIEHMLRNAVTHGIETREQRLTAGKPEIGEISMALTQEGNEIILSMADDGKGLESERIRARAEALGLLTPGQSADAATLFDFIFQPGFSTATELTQVSGRGVGMDVVKTEVTALGGRIEIVSLAGQGTTFRLYLPLTLAVTKTLRVRAGTRLYAVPSTMVEQVQELKEKQLAALRDKGEAEWQGNTYPLHYLPHLLGDIDAVPEAHRRYWVLLLRSGTQRVAVLVDELKGNQEVVVKNIGAQLSRVVGIAGATVLGDGLVVLILNPVALASRAPVVQVHATLPIATAKAKPPTVMVVDDSLTVRKIISRLLAREGYQVILAKDGVDALEQLLDVLPDVILSDIEMPRMDGFDFVRNLRADERLRDLPVIMITSRTADKHRNYAFQIGANHYLGKPYDEEELLGLVAGYVAAKGGA